MSDWNICDFGAVGDGVTDDTAAMQAAVNRCSEQGGGRVIAPSGRTFLANGVQLLSNVEFHIERGAVLLAGGDIDAYLDPPAGSKSRCAIGAVGADNVAITGGGKIDGNGRSYIREKLPHIYRMAEKRPSATVALIGCKRADIGQIRIEDGAHWTLVVTGCEDVRIDGIRILNDLKLPNSDGIDINHSRNVRVSGCHIESGDDCIVLKTTKGYQGYGPCENITVTGCTLMSTSCALIVGCEAGEPMRNIVFDSCVIRSSHRGLGIHLSEESDVEHVVFSNMIVETRLFHPDWWGAAEPIYLAALPWTEKDRVGRIRHVRISNILCRGENGVFIQGWTQDHLEDIVLDRVRVELDKVSGVPGARHDIRPCPGEGLLTHHTSGFFIRNAGRVELRDCEVAWGSHVPDDFKYAVESRGVRDLFIDNLRGTAAHPDKDEAVFQA